MNGWGCGIERPINNVIDDAYAAYVVLFLAFAKANSLDGH